MPKTETIGYLIEPDQMKKLRNYAIALCAGSDAMRDIGNPLWVLIWDIESMEIKEGDEV